MGHQVIRQPDGQLCVFSSGSDRIVIADATAEDVADYFAEMAAASARESAKRYTDAVLAGEPRKVYYQFVLTYDEAVADHRESGGEERMICGTAPEDGAGQ